jgi:hypothetical protein
LGVDAHFLEGFDEFICTNFKKYPVKDKPILDYRVVKQPLLTTGILLFCLEICL